MISEQKTTGEKSILEGFCALYYLLIQADGVISDKELQMGKIMCRHEHFDEDEFDRYMGRYKSLSQTRLHEVCVQILSAYSYDDQARCVAWMSKIANSDGFMSPEEWSLLFKIYKKELRIDQEDILKVQKHLPVI